ncbi:LPS-assembly lipoprotein LptE [Candidatus Providencia siddallii]|uniref:LPS-assembly lipoprotein LptE n=1 Tax=Candidatus Providencia siddallii TaxID=1715285 RepID=A0A0M6W7X8_9GAMM|nr:LPS-assembly lipoprotein LptE [Candidatus Providencia siddallii]
MLRIIILLLLTLNITSCGFNFQNKYQYNNIKTLQIISNKQINYFIKFLIEEIKLNNIKLINTNNDNKTPILKIINFYEDTQTLSIFQNGKAAEKQLSFIVKAELLMCNNKSYLLNIKIDRTFFDNPLEALAKDSEKDIILQEMQEQAAYKLIQNLLITYSSEFKKIKFNT